MIGDVMYLYQGIMLMAIRYREDYWISQGVFESSGGVYIANASAEGGTGESLEYGLPSSGISVNGNIYSYQLSRYRGNIEGGEDSPCDLTNTEFNYAIYE